MACLGLALGFAGALGAMVIFFIPKSCFGREDPKTSRWTVRAGEALAIMPGELLGEPSSGRQVESHTGKTTVSCRRYTSRFEKMRCSGMS